MARQKATGGDAANEAKVPACPVARLPKTAELIAGEIRRQIIRGDLGEGDYLPLEGEMIATYNVSRPTLREAFRILEAERLISVVRGSRSGARVHAPAAGAVSRYAGYVLQSQAATIKDIYDSRLAIEPFCAWGLARARDLASADVLTAHADRLKGLAAQRRHVEFAVGNVEFHRCLVERAGNRTLLLITDMLQDIVAAHQVERTRRRTLDDAAEMQLAVSGLRSFARLIALIRAGDAEGAAAHWRVHLVNASRAWIPLEDRARKLDVLG